MRRRDFLTALAGFAADWPLVAAAQGQDAPVIGFLGVQTVDPKVLAKFHQGLERWGYFEGQNLKIEYQWASHNQQLSELAAKLVEHRVTLIVTSGSMASAKAAKDATT